MYWLSTNGYPALWRSCYPYTLRPRRTNLFMVLQYCHYLLLTLFLNPFCPFLFFLQNLCTDYAVLYARCFAVRLQTSPTVSYVSPR